MRPEDIRKLRKYALLLAATGMFHTAYALWVAKKAHKLL